MTTIGIDIGGRMHVVARCRDGQPRADREILRVSQSRGGFAALDAWLERQPEPVTLVTMESSGHYWMPLASHLRRREVPVAVVNPLAAKYFARSRLGRTKSDPADARSLAEMAMRDTPPARDPLTGAELRQAARFAMTLVTEQAKVCQRLIRLVELGFPELGELFDDPTCRTAREVLRIAPTARSAARRRPTTLANANAGPGHRRLGQAKAERLQTAAAETIAVPELEAEVAFEVGLLLDQYDLLERQIEEADRRVASLLDSETARRLQTIPGVGPSIAATLLAEIGDCRARFPDPESLACLAGVAPSTRSSGRHHAVTYRWASNKKLRDALCDFAGDSWQSNAWAETRYRELRAAGKSHPHSERILARSWAHIIWRCWQDHTPYDPARHGAHQRLTEKAA